MSVGSTGTWPGIVGGTVWIREMRRRREGPEGGAGEGEEEGEGGGMRVGPWTDNKVDVCQ